MRDLLVILTVTVLLLSALKSPVMGVYAWAWLSLMNPHKLAYGFAMSLPLAQASAIMSMVGLAIARDRQRLSLNFMLSLYFALLAWMTLTSFTALNRSELVWERWIFVMKIQIMLIVTWLLVIDAKQLRTLVWVVTASVAFFGVKGGLFTLATGGSGRVWGPPGSLLDGNNELAVALVMLQPFLYWLRQTTPRRWIQHGLSVGMALCALAILGTQSRGALLALLAMSAFLSLKSTRPVLASIVIGGLVLGAIAFMPESWTSRMETIGTYQADSSAMSRIYTWTTLWNAAIDRPLVGVGFRADNALVFTRYAPTDPQFLIFNGVVLVAHSIYFQMLGEHGFVGLMLFLVLGFASWRNAARLSQRSQSIPELSSWMPLLMRMVQVSLIGYAVGGAFLSLAYLDLTYYIIGYLVTSEAIVRRCQAGQATSLPVASAVVDGRELHARES